MLLRLTVLLVLYLIPLAAICQESAQQQVQLDTSVVFGAQTLAPAVLFQYREPSNTSCQFTGETVIKIPAMTNNFPVNLASIFPTGALPVVIGIEEISSPGMPVDLGLSSSGPRIHIASGGFFIGRVALSSPTLYLDNPSGSNAVLIKVFGVSNP